jgi:hypothetical protein
MGRATELWNELMKGFPEGEDPREKRLKLRPEMRLAPDAVVEADRETKARDALERLGAEGVNCVEVRDEELGVDAVLLTAERYVDLMTRLLASEPTIGDHARLQPRHLADSNLEQVDPQASWDAYFRSPGGR